MKKRILVAALVLPLVLAAELRLAAVCPRPGVLDANGKESGWVELLNDGQTSVNLGDYEFVRVNRGKELKAGKAKKNLVAAVLQPGGSIRILTSEAYPNCEDLGGSGVVEVFNGAQVYPAKVNPKKFPFVALYRKSDAEAVLIDFVAIPVDLSDGSVFVRDWTVESRYAWAIQTGDTRTPYGPNVGPLYGVKHSLTDLAPTEPAQPGAAYPVSFAVNPVSSLPGDQIVLVELDYQTYSISQARFRESKFVAMTKTATDKSAGAVYTAAIPAADVPGAGRLIRWRARITDGDGNVWTSPSFRNPDDGYAWYGTISACPELVDARIPTWHLFVEGNSKSQMDVDADKQDLTKVPYNARCAIYDSSTGRYYDNVRIDLRGNTSGGYRKKSHGFRFAKCNVYTGTNPLDGETISIRKTSLTAEYGDPTYLRQALAFWAFRRAGCLVPFMYPVRVNLNGAFYQLAFHSARFSDELIEDQYKLDPEGYAYKNSGCLTPTLKNWVVCEKKTPDDGDETSQTAYAPLRAWTTAFGAGMEAAVDNQPSVTREVVRTFDLPAWINYLAEARITQECDDSWANLSTYWDKNGTGTWMPLGYDMNQSWGYIYRSQWDNNWRGGLLADEDRHKSHPFFGGRRVLCYLTSGARSHAGSENWAFEAVWQSEKFRRLYLRRLRTLMDEQLGRPGTPKEETPIWQYVTRMTNAIAESARLDTAKWRYDDDWWKKTTSPYGRALTLEEGIEDLWTNYIVPRRTHLYETHSVHNTAKGVGYGEGLSAGIPDAQLPVALLRSGIDLLALNEDELILFNRNIEAVDLSGWRLSGAVTWTLPAGTVIDAGDTLTVVRDRQAWIAAHAAELASRVVVGNAAFTGTGTVTLTAVSNGEEVGPGLSPDAGRWARWFDADAQTYATAADPAQIAADVSRGVWTTERNGTGRVVSRAGVKTIDVRGDAAAGDALVFTPSTAQRLRRRVIIETSALFSDAVDSPETHAGSFAELTLVRDAAGSDSFCLFDGTVWRFLGHESVVAEPDVAYRIRLSLDYRSTTPTLTCAVRVGLGWVTLATADGRTEFPVTKPVEAVAFAGFGEIGGVSGDYPVESGLTIRIE